VYSPGDVAVGDFNGDGIPDLAIAILGVSPRVNWLSQPKGPPHCVLGEDASDPLVRIIFGSRNLGTVIRIVSDDNYFVL
jgi:hypothetical protein